MTTPSREPEAPTLRALFNDFRKAQDYGTHVEEEEAEALLLNGMDTALARATEAERERDTAYMEAESEMRACARETERCAMLKEQVAHEHEGFLRVTEENNELRQRLTASRAEGEKMRVAIVECALPYEALLLDTSSWKWIAPEIRTVMIAAVAAARSAALPTPSNEGAKDG